MALAGALGISTAPILVTLSGVDPTTAAFWRFAYALPVLGLLCGLRPAARNAFRSRGWFALGIAAGLFYALDMTLWHYSLLLIGAGPGTLLANTQIVWVALFGVIALGERPSRVFWAGLPVLLTGLWLLGGGGLDEAPLGQDRRGIGFGLLAGLFYAAALVCMRRVQIIRPVPPESLLLLMLGVGLAVTATVSFADGSRIAVAHIEAHLWLVLLGAGVQVVAWIWITRGLRALPGHHSAMLLLAQPVASLFLGWWILGQALTQTRFAGALLVLAAIAVPILRETRGAVPGPAIASPPAPP